MIFDQSQQNLNAWKTQMHLYEKDKRTKKPFGKNLSQVDYVTHEKIKQKQCSFNPILQEYQRHDDEKRAKERSEQMRAKSLMGHLKQTLKYEKSFDIVNLQSNEPYQEKTPLRKLGPIRNIYNVVNNQRIPQFYLKNREMRLPLERQKKLFDYHKKDYNIVTNIYKKDHEEKMKNEVEKQEHEVTEKYWNTHTYNPVNGHFYSQKQEQEFQKDREMLQHEHGKDAEKKLPPSYVYRQPFIADYTKPLPEALKILDERNANAKKRFQTKYAVFDEYEKRNLQEESHHENNLKSHIHFGRILDQKAKEFDIITNKPYKESRAEELYGKKLEVPNWQHLIKQASRSPTLKYSIKSGGFS